jgi:hypothetical protein
MTSEEFRTTRKERELMWGIEVAKKAGWIEAERNITKRLEQYRKRKEIEK